MVEQTQQWLPLARRGLLESYRSEATSVWIEASGGSMRPLIAPADWMLVEFGAEPRGLGEIVLFPVGDLLVAHRVVGRRRQRDETILIAKGDAEAYCDPPLRLSDVIGVLRALRYGPAGPASRVGLAGRPAHAIAKFSHWTGRGAALVRRAAAFLPDPLRRAGFYGIPPLSRSAVQLLLAPLRWTAWLQQAVKLNTVERR